MNSLETRSTTYVERLQKRPFEYLSGKVILVQTYLDLILGLNFMFKTLFIHETIQDTKPKNSKPAAYHRTRRRQIKDHVFILIIYKNDIDQYTGTNEI